MDNEIFHHSIGTQSQAKGITQNSTTQTIPETSSINLKRAIKSLALNKLAHSEDSFQSFFKDERHFNSPTSNQNEEALQGCSGIKINETKRQKTKENESKDATNQFSIVKDTHNNQADRQVSKEIVYLRYPKRNDKIGCEKSNINNQDPEETLDNNDRNDYDKTVQTYNSQKYFYPVKRSYNLLNNLTGAEDNDSDSNLYWGRSKSDDQTRIKSNNKILDVSLISSRPSMNQIITKENKEPINIYEISSKKKISRSKSLDKCAIGKHIVKFKEVFDDTGQTVNVQYNENTRNSKKNSSTLNLNNSENWALTEISLIIEEVNDLEEEILNFQGISFRDKDYMYLEEVMLRNLIKLDDIETKNSYLIKDKRRAAIQFIQKMMNSLSVKLEQNQQKMQELSALYFVDSVSDERNEKDDGNENEEEIEDNK